MQLVHPAHDRQVRSRHRARSVIEAAAAQLQNPCLTRQRQGVRTVDHRLALSRPALLSAPSKKSFSQVRAPILACSVFTSPEGSPARPASDPNPPAAPSSSRPFQSVIWFGCTSKSCASSASVFSPFTAAKATFALKAAVWFRLARLVMVSPDPRHTRRSQAENPLILLPRFPKPPLIASAPRRPISPRT